MRKKLINIALFTVIFAFIAAFIPLNTPVYAQSNSALIAVELNSGRVLKESNADAKLSMASTTKIMTALIIAEDCDLERVVTVPDCAVGVEGSSVYLKKDEEINVKDLLYGLMLRSGNDCAAALAVIHSGSEEKFVEKMNSRAKELGANNTHFANPSGLPDNDHYTTARDLALIACAAMKNNIVKQVVSTKNYNGKYRSFTNKNKMLYNYQGANGVKTGYTVKAGRCLVSSAERFGFDVICVVLNCPDMYVESCNMLDYCFSNFEQVELSGNRLFMCGNSVCKLNNSEKFLIKKGEKITYKTVPFTKEESRINGGSAGKIQFYEQKSLIFEGNLYSIDNR